MTKGTPKLFKTRRVIEQQIEQVREALKFWRHQLDEANDHNLVQEQIDYAQEVAALAKQLDFLNRMKRNFGG